MGLLYNGMPAAVVGDLDSYPPPIGADVDCDIEAGLPMKNRIRGEFRKHESEGCLRLIVLLTELRQHELPSPSHFGYIWSE